MASICRSILIGAGALVALTPSAIPGVTADAASVVAGECVFLPGSASFTSSPFGTAPTFAVVFIQATGTCAGNGFVNTVTVDFSGTMVLSCEAGEGTLVGTATWSNGVPPSQVGFTALTVFSAGVFDLSFTSPSLPGSATYVVSSGALTGCLGRTVTGAPLTGDMAYVAVSS